MTVILPEPLEGYFSASNAHDADRLAGFFADGARVHDEKHAFEGRKAIRDWADGTAEKYRHRTDVLTAQQAGDRCIVTARVTGRFPGSPIELRYRFRLEDRKIKELEIG
jgi:ketosteroid isomerase-like protein